MRVETYRDLTFAFLFLSVVLFSIGALTAYSAELEPESRAYRVCGGALGGGGEAETAECYKRELEKSSLAGSIIWFIGGTIAFVASRVFRSRGRKEQLLHLTAEEDSG